MRNIDRLFISAMLFAAVLSILFSGCKATPIIGGPVDHEKLVDGVYEGNFKGGLNKALVKVTIKDKKIADVQIIEHKTGRGKKAEPIIPKSIVEKQSTKVDAVSGATNSSHVIMNAVQKAIEKACQANP